MTHPNLLTSEPPNPDEQATCDLDLSKVQQFAEIFGHRLSKEWSQSGDWVVWTTSSSSRTLAKFLNRARASGFRSVFVNDGRLGCHVTCF